MHAHTDARKPGEYSANSGPARLVPGPELSNEILLTQALHWLTCDLLTSAGKLPNSDIASAKTKFGLVSLILTV